VTERVDRSAQLGRIARELARKALDRSAIAIAASVGVSILFKLAAFVREAYVAAKFGVTSQTDAYFVFQQFPHTLYTFICGAFCLAFVPALARAKQEKQGGQWLTAVLSFSVGGAIVLNVLCLAGAPILVKIFSQSGQRGATQVLTILSFSFVPLVLIGIWNGICLANGRNIAAMVSVGVPYMLMAVALIGLCTIWGPNQLSLPISMTFGWAVMGLASLIFMARREPLVIDWQTILHPMRLNGMRLFVKELGASSIENLGYAANQLSVVWFLSHTREGAVSANNYAMRIGMLALSLFSFPLSQLAQAKMCTSDAGHKKRVLLRFLLLSLVSVGGLGLVTITFRTEAVRLIYMRGKFSINDLHAVCNFVPAWLVYVLVMTGNFLIARYEFSVHRGATYARRMWCAYGAGNALRFAVLGMPDPSLILWCAVAAEGVAFLFGLRRCLADSDGIAEPISACTETVEA
jgi:putative peptidoglycan lipid II flippase